MIMFLLGALFILVIVPLCESVISMIQTWIECKTSYWAIKLQKAAEEAGIENQENNSDCTQVIGFEVPTVACCDEDDE